LCHSHLACKHESDDLLSLCSRMKQWAAACSLSWPLGHLLLLRWLAGPATQPILQQWSLHGLETLETLIGVNLATLTLELSLQHTVPPHKRFLNVFPAVVPPGHYLKNPGQVAPCPKRRVEIWHIICCQLYQVRAGCDNAVDRLCI
jgi:hypothetical protein